MKKLVLLFIGCVLLTSCSDKKKENTPQKEEEASRRKISIVFEAIYEKDDKISMAFKKDGYWDYVNLSPFTIVGQPTMQKLTFDVPEGLNIENVQIELSSNKEQKSVKLNSIYIFENGKQIIDGSNMQFIKYFNTGSGLTWDEKNLRYNLIFGGEFPPGICGNEVLESMLVK
jgi:hypothetical protein